MYTKINLDEIELKDIISSINHEVKENNSIFFYNSQNGDVLNKEKIFSIIYYIRKYKININYFFYNIPYCLFKSFWNKFIENHCIRNRLCNYYEGYITYNKCNRCKFGLFCNNFNWNIPVKDISDLDWWYQETVSKEYLLNIIWIYYTFVLSLWYSEDEISFYTTQKYIVELLTWKVDVISKEYLDYLTLYFLVPYWKKSALLFESLDSFTLVLKDKKIENDFIYLIKKYWVNVNFTVWEGTNILNYNFKDFTIKLDYYYSREKNLHESNFFSFTHWLTNISDSSMFYWKVLNPINLNVINKVAIVKKAVDVFEKQSDIFIWRDILSWINLNNYKGILISSDWLWDKWRLVQSLNSIKIPVIYDITPDITNILQDGDAIEINFKTWKIFKI